LTVNDSRTLLNCYLCGKRWQPSYAAALATALEVPLRELLSHPLELIARGSVRAVTPPEGEESKVAVWLKAQAEAVRILTGQGLGSVYGYISAGEFDRAQERIDSIAEEFGYVR
jgi:hypothetical protein